MAMFNPSLARAPKGLCPRCAYLVSLRLDTLHQCDASSPLFAKHQFGKAIATGAWFKGTVLGVADSAMNVLSWSWFLARPEDQVRLCAAGMCLRGDHSSSDLVDSLGCHGDASWGVHRRTG